SESAETIGAMASKKASALVSRRRATAAASASDVSGPVATTPGDGSSVASPRTTVIRGWPVTRSWTACEDATRSTASAAPPGERPGGLAPREPAADYYCFQLATDSAGAASSTTTSCPHFRHLRETPLVLVCFSSIPTNPQLGQATATGRFHVE